MYYDTWNLVVQYINDPSSFRNIALVCKLTARVCRNLTAKKKKQYSRHIEKNNQSYFILPNGQIEGWYNEHIFGYPNCTYEQIYYVNGKKHGMYKLWTTVYDDDPTYKFDEEGKQMFLCWNTLFYYLSMQVQYVNDQKHGDCYIWEYSNGRILKNHLIYENGNIHN